MSGFDNVGVDREFFLGTNIKSNFICSLGYGDPTSLLPRNPRLSLEEAGWFARASKCSRYLRKKVHTPARYAPPVRGIPSQASERQHSPGTAWWPNGRRDRMGNSSLSRQTSISIKGLACAGTVARHIPSIGDCAKFRALAYCGASPRNVMDPGGCGRQ